MSTYKLPDIGKQRVKKEYFRMLVFIIVPVLIIVLIPGFVFAYKYSQSIFSTILLFTLALILCIISTTLLIVSYITLKKLQSLQFTITNDGIIQEQQGKEPILLKRADIKHLVEITGMGILIKSQTTSSSIFIPNDIERFDELKSEISTWAPMTAEQSKTDRTKVIIYLLIFSWAILLTASLLTENKILDLIAGTMFIISIVFGFILNIMKFLKFRKKLFDSFII